MFIRASKITTLISKSSTRPCSEITKKDQQVKLREKKNHLKRQNLADVRHPALALLLRCICSALLSQYSHLNNFTFCDVQNIILYDIPSISDFLINANDLEGNTHGRNNKFDLLDRFFLSDISQISVYCGFNFRVHC